MKEYRVGNIVKVYMLHDNAQYYFKISGIRRGVNNYFDVYLIRNDTSGSKYKFNLLYKSLSNFPIATEEELRNYKLIMDNLYG